MAQMTWIELACELISQTKCYYTLHPHTRGIPILVAVMVNHTLSSVGEAETDTQIKTESVKMAVYCFTYLEKNNEEERKRSVLYFK